jgi:1,4-dihydroxy-2-naphthoyl-CoA synthase
LNSLTFEVYRELSETLVALRTREAVRVVVITGQGRGFCSGGDVEEIIGELFKRDMGGLLQFTRQTCELIRNLRLLPKPVIASLNGTVAGAGENRFSICQSGPGRRRYGRGLSAAENRRPGQGDRAALYGRFPERRAGG